MAHSSAFHCQPLVAEVEYLCDKWRIPQHQLYSISFDDGDPFLKIAYEQLQQDHNNTNGSLCVALPRLHKDLTLSYLSLTPKPLSSAFAALRFNRCRLQSYLHSRHLADSPLCPFCHSASETVEHLLLVCPHFADARASCFSSINHFIEYQFDISIELLLGSYSLLPIHKSSVPLFIVSFPLSSTASFRLFVCVIPFNHLHLSSLPPPPLSVSPLLVSSPQL